MSTRRRYRLKPLIQELQEARKTEKKTLTVIFLTFALLTVVTLFTFGFFKAVGLTGDDRCRLADAPQSNEMQTYLYDFVMRRRAMDGKPQYVAMITISEGSEPMSVITNTCMSRRFLTALIPQLVKLGVKVIAVDQSFSKGSCPDDTAYQDEQTHKDILINDQLRQTFESAKFESANIPIIVGLGTHRRTKETTDDDCLMLNGQFEFNPKDSNEKPRFSEENVFYGLIRLNDNNLKIPLAWWAFPYTEKPPRKEDAALQKESFSLVTAKHVPDSRVVSDEVIAQDIVSNEHPYGSFVSDVPKWSAMDVLCNSGEKVARKGEVWGDDKVCDRIDHKNFDALEGKVVVVGSEIASDLKPFLDGQRSGAELHADYIEALLRKHYVKTAPEWLDGGAVALFVVLMLFFQFLAVRRLPAYKGLRDDTALGITWGIFAAFALTGFVLLKWIHLFFPIVFVSCFPIFVSLFALSLYQIQFILTQIRRKRREGVAE